MTPSSTLPAPPVKISHHTFADLFYNEQTSEHSLHASREFFKEEVITPFKAALTLQQPGRFTVQASADTHITLLPGFLKYVNHNCSPNTFFDMEKMAVICLRHILPGDELSFFYPSTEWDMAEPFTCSCNYANCLKTISGARYLPGSVVRQYKVNGFITLLKKPSNT